MTFLDDLTAAIDQHLQVESERLERLITDYLLAHPGVLLDEVELCRDQATGESWVQRRRS